MNRMWYPGKLKHKHGEEVHRDWYPDDDRVMTYEGNYLLWPWWKRATADIIYLPYGYGMALFVSIKYEIGRRLGFYKKVNYRLGASFMFKTLYSLYSSKAKPVYLRAPVLPREKLEHLLAKHTMEISAGEHEAH